MDQSDRILNLLKPEPFRESLKKDSGKSCKQVIYSNDWIKQQNKEIKALLKKI